MTTLQMQLAPPFQAPITEDAMEITSDMDQRAGAGDDIDIDLDLTGDVSQDGEDEFMGEEDMNALVDSISVDGQESHAANDDEMADDSYAPGPVDEGSSVRDEEIEDAEYAGPDLDDDTIVEPDIDHSDEQSERQFVINEETVGDQNREQVYQEQEYNEQENHEQPTMSETASAVIERALPNGQMGLVNPSPDVAKVATREASDVYDFEVNNVATVSHGVATQTPELSGVDGLIAPEAKLEQAGEEVLPASSDQEIEAQLNVEASRNQKRDSSNGPAHLHPVVLDYQGDEMFLFPPVDRIGDHAATFLLPDEQLAYGTIGSLLEACRGVLIGSLNEQDELMININDLDLHISESTIESASTRLSEVIDLYVHLQQNDGLENPPPLYMDLTSSSRFSRRLDLLRNGLIEGKGLSQLASFPEMDNDQQHNIDEETDPSSHIAVLSSDETYASEQQLGEEEEESPEQHDSRSNPLPSKNLLLETRSAAQGTQSYPVTDIAQENDRTEPQLGSDTSPHEAGISDDFSREAAFLEPTQSLAGISELEKVEESIVDDGDFIDYEDVEEPGGGASSASSTLQGDAIDVNAVHDSRIPEEPVIAENQDHRSRDFQENAEADEATSHDLVDRKDADDIGGPVGEKQPNLAGIFSQDSDDNGRGLSGSLDEEGEASGNDQIASISQETDLPPKVSANDQQQEASARYEDDAESYRHDTLHEHADQTEGDAIFNGEIEGHFSTHPFQLESSSSERSFRDDVEGKANNAEADNDLEQAGRSLANEDNDDVAQGVNTQSSLFVDESAQPREDDDEITYEDEEDDIDFSHEPAKAEHNVATSPGSLKRARSLHEDDDALDEDLQGAKRVRSG